MTSYSIGAGTDSPNTTLEFSDDRFPSNASRQEQLRFLLHYAVLAPSGHNAQPWLFRLKNGAIQLHADKNRALPIIDPRHRELTISCGGALFNIRVALRHFGHRDARFSIPRRPTARSPR
jgi:hypothetical protein